MTAESQNFTVHGGDSRILNVTVLDAEGDAVNITDAAVGFSIHTPANSSSSAVSKTVGNGITITDGPNGKFKVVLDPKDTNIVASGNCPYECRLTDAAGYVTTIMTGNMVVK